MAFNTTGSAGLAQAGTVNGTTSAVPTVPGNLLKLMIAEARLTPQLEGNLTSLFLNDPLPQGMGTTYNSPKFGPLTAASLVQGVDMQQQQALTAVNVVVTPAEVGVQIILTRKSMAQWSEDVAMRAGRIMRDAMDRKKDSDISGLFAGFSRSTGGATTVPSLGTITAAVAKLASGSQVPATGVAQAAGLGYDAQAGPFIGVCTPVTVHYLTRGLLGGPSTTASVTTSSIGLTGDPGSLQDQAARSGFQSGMVGDLGGATIYRNANLAKVASNDESDGFIGTKDAIVFVPMNYDALGAIDTEVDLSLRAVELNYVEDYGFAELDDMKGIEWVVNNAPPTS
jgi:hypothetical protein